VDGYHVSKKALWTLAGGALGALAVPLLGKVFESARPAIVSAVKEGYGFKEWLVGKVERAKEDVQDVVAEGIYSYHQDLNDTAEAVKREKQILEKVEKLVEERLAKTSAKKEA
jgi:hypothetical protein